MEYTVACRSRHSSTHVREFNGSKGQYKDLYAVGEDYVHSKSSSSRQAYFESIEEANAALAMFVGEHPTLEVIEVA